MRRVRVGTGSEVEAETDFSAGQDFLFLFDLLAHTAGLEATLR